MTRAGGEGGLGQSNFGPGGGMTRAGGEGGLGQSNFGPGGGMPRAGGDTGAMLRAGGGGARSGGVTRAGSGDDIMYADIQTVQAVDSRHVMSGREQEYLYQAGAIGGVDRSDDGMGARGGNYSGGQNRIRDPGFVGGSGNLEDMRQMPGRRDVFGERGVGRQGGAEDVVYSEIRHDQRFVAGNAGVGGAGQRPREQAYPPFQAGGGRAVGGGNVRERSPPVRARTAWESRPAQREPLPVSADQIRK